MLQNFARSLLAVWTFATSIFLPLSTAGAITAGEEKKIGTPPCPTSCGRCLELFVLSLVLSLHSALHICFAIKLLYSFGPRTGSCFIVCMYHADAADTFCTLYFTLSLILITVLGCCSFAMVVFQPTVHTTETPRSVRSSQKFAYLDYVDVVVQKHIGRGYVICDSGTYRSRIVVVSEP